MLNRNQLHEYQNRLVSNIIETNKIALWCGLGIGKTLTTLTAIADLSDSFDIHKTLIICPLRVANSVWHSEINNWSHLSHLKYRICTGTETNRLAQLMLPSDIYIINRENVPWLVNFYGKKFPFDCVVIDESSSFKSSKSQRFKALKKVTPFIDRMIQLTATPASNGMMDVWAQIALLDGGERLGRNMTAFKQRYFDQDYMGFKHTIKEGAQKLIEDKIADITVSMQSEDYLEMPQRTDLIEYVELKPSILKRYKAFERDLVLEMNTVEDDVLAANAAVLAGKLLQYASGSNYIDDTGAYEKIHNGKIETIAQIVEENPDENMLVAYNFKFDLDALKEKFPDAVVLGKDGSDIDAWNRGEIKMLLCHPASAGMGINLQHGGSMLIWFSLTWSLEYYQQFNGRLHRQGQTLPVRIVHIITKDTIDERVLKVLGEKDAVQDKLLTALK